MPQAPTPSVPCPSKGGIRLSQAVQRNPAAVAAWTRHDDDRFPSIVRSGAVLGVQFHPEKSSAAGVALLRAVVAAARAGAA